MLHVDPSSIVAAPPTFDPFAYLAYVRSCGMTVRAREVDGVRSLDWDMSALHEPVGDDSEHASQFQRSDDPGDLLAVWHVLRAEEWIEGARACGLEVMPWRLNGDDAGGVLTFGQDESGDDSFSAGTARLSRLPASRAVDDCRRGVVFETLCHQLGLDEDDPDFFAKAQSLMMGRCQ